MSIWFEPSWFLEISQAKCFEHISGLQSSAAYIFIKNSLSKKNFFPCSISITLKKLASIDFFKKVLQTYESKTFVDLSNFLRVFLRSGQDEYG